MSARNDILRALGADPEARPGRFDRPEPKPPGFISPDPWDAFREEFESLGGRFLMARGLDSARSALAGLIREYGVKTAAAWEHPLLDAFGLAELMAREGVELLTSGDEKFVERAASAGIGITAADALLLESGSIVLHSGAGLPRSASLLPPVHLAVVEPGMILPDASHLPNLVRHVAAEEGGMPRAFHVISGPSATADIELIKVLGVHGPTELVVLAVAGP